MNEKKSPNQFVIGLLCGLSLTLAFYLGHFFWPQNTQTQKIESSLTTNNNLLNKPKINHGQIPICQNTVADIANQVSGSVVNIDISKTVTVANSLLQMPFNEFDFFFGPNQSPLGINPQPRKYEKKGSGSGFIIRSDGFILTNNHVVGQADDIVVTLNDKRKFKGKVWGRDSYTDLALVKIEGDNLPVATLGNTKDIRPGDFVIAIGSPLGLDHTVTFGIISALGRSLGDLNSNLQLIQTDAAINPGNSGGPLLNIQGEVIGINTAIRGDGQNIGFAIPVDLAKDISQQLLEHKKIQRPYLGIYMQDLDDKLALSLGLQAKTQGVIVAKVIQDSPAQLANLLQGDVITKIDGKSVISAKDIQEIVKSHKLGDKLHLLILRQGQFAPIELTVGEYPDKNIK